ncbi:hypothetical protein CGZ93_10445 [Enemella dayhoffiae]|uniref:ParB-like N-terminal domain-containing protein n=1 Tax=Enemella dayhoffiae TaxID=2016507 RepID=A0A255H1B2_9ACTN|nr:ParB/RepB/Spo0J family partition protein [Enemella dayhoffiae]OYO21488.1 hypothetical protein CGZ93_10445 [Enemella dayhoffiae]
MAKAAAKVAPTQLRRGTGTRRNGMAAGLMAARAADQGHQLIALDQIARNPENPSEGRVEDVSDLTESIKEVGILQALLVCSRAAYLAERPEVDVEPGEWVLLAGERRILAARAAGLSEAPVVVRDDLATPGLSHAVASAENGLRQGLSPLQEARQYQAMADAGLPQRRIAALVGRSPGHIAKRLKLTQVDPEILEGLGSRLEINAAYALAEVPAAEQRAVLERADRNQDNIGEYAITRAAQWIADDRAGAVALEKELAKGGTEVRDVPYYQLITGNEKEITAARKAGTLILARNEGSARIQYGDSRLERSSAASESIDKAAETRAVMKQLRAGVDRWIGDHLSDYQTSQDRTSEFAAWIVDRMSVDEGVEAWKMLRDRGIGPAYDADAWTTEERRGNFPYRAWLEGLTEADRITVAALLPVISDLRACTYSTTSEAAQRTKDRAEQGSASTEAPTTDASTEAPQTDGDRT